MARFYCKDCNYRFRPKGDKVPTICPYCGKKGHLIEEKNIFNEVMEEME